MGGYIKDRTLGIGGSDVGPILGLSRYRGALHTYLEKRKELPPEQVEQNKEGKEFGTLCEAIAARIYTERTGRRVWKPGRTFRHSIWRYMLANPDRLQEDLTRGADARSLIEVKWLDASQRAVWVNQGVPEGYYLQLQHYLLVTGFNWGTFVVVFGGNKLEYFDVPRDQEVINRLIELEGEFWRRVLEGNPPDITFDEMGKKLLTRMYPKQEPGKEMILDDQESITKMKRFFALEATIEQRKAELLQLEVWLKEKIGLNEKCLIPGVAELTWKWQQANRIDAKLLREKEPIIAAKYSKQSDSRVFRKKDLTIKEDGVIELVPDEMITTMPQAARMITFDE